MNRAIPKSLTLDVSPAAVTVFVHMWVRMDMQSLTVACPLSEMETLLRMSRTTIRKAVKELEMREYMTVLEKGDGRTPTTYLMRGGQDVTPRGVQDATPRGTADDTQGSSRRHPQSKKGQVNTHKDSAASDEPKPYKREGLRSSEVLSYVFETWNQQGVVKHARMSGQMEKSIARTVDDYGVDDTVAAIQLYGQVLHSDDHYWTHKFPLVVFLQDKNIGRFLPDTDPLTNFLKRDANGKTKTVPREIRCEKYEDDSCKGDWTGDDPPCGEAPRCVSGWIPNPERATA